MNPGPPTAPWPHADVHRDNPKSQIDHHQNPNHNLHVTLLKTQTQISHAPPPQIKTQTHRLASPATDQRCWRWVWLHRREGDFCPGGSGTCRARSGQRLEKRRQGRKLTGLESECREELCQSVGGRRTFDGVWGGVVSLCRWCVEVELKGFVAVSFSWNWN